MSSSISAIIISKNGSTSSLSIDNQYNEYLYKKCGFKTNGGFRCVHEWSLEFNNIVYGLRVYGKTTGRAGSENKYEFPPPIDNTLFFSKCAVVNTVNGEPVNISTKEFDDIMEYLHGGFEDISDTEDEDEDEDELDDAKSYTKEGYEKDGFIVDDDDEEEPLQKKTKVIADSKKKKSSAKSKKNDEPIYYEYGDELTEEDYV